MLEAFKRGTPPCFHTSKSVYSSWHTEYYSSRENGCIMFSVALEGALSSLRKITLVICHQGYLGLGSEMTHFNWKPALRTRGMELERHGCLPGREGPIKSIMGSVGSMVSELLPRSKTSVTKKCGSQSWQTCQCSIPIQDKLLYGLYLFFYDPAWWVRDIWFSAALVATIFVFFNLSLVSPPAVCKSNAKSLEYCYNKIPILLPHFLSIECHSSGSQYCTPKCTQMSVVRLAFFQAPKAVDA